MPPTPRHRRVLALLATTGLLLLAAGVSENLERLRAMPPERRQWLAAQLAAWQRLPIDERQAVRDLDTQLAALPVAERDRLLRLMRRYTLWLQGLPAPQRQKIEQAGPDERVGLVSDLRGHARPPRIPPRLLNRDLLQVSALSPRTLDASVLDLKLWFSLGAEVRTQILQNPNPSRQEQQFRKLADASEAYQALKAEQEQRSAQALEELKHDLTRRRRLDLPKVAQPKGEALRKGLELRQLRGFEPEAVTLRNLGRFEAAMPPWVRQSLDLLPPDVAEWRLKVLYRLTFPAPTELPEPAPPPKRGPAGKGGAPRAPAGPGTVF